MRHPLSILSLSLAALALTGAAQAQGSDPLAAAVKARQSHMTLYATNLGVLGGMAQGQIDYDAEAAVAAAGNLVALAGIDQRSYWPEGTEAGAIDGSRALPAIWEDRAGYDAQVADLLAASEAMLVAAGTDLDALRGAMGPVGGTCGACHEAYRQSR